MSVNYEKKVNYKKSNEMILYKQNKIQPDGE